MIARESIRRLRRMLDQAEDPATRKAIKAAIYEATERALAEGAR